MRQWSARRVRGTLMQIKRKMESVEAWTLSHFAG